MPERLNCWKAIAAYLKRDERTVRRWEKEGLPVHRHLHAKKASVYAYTSEIDLWWNRDRTRLGTAAALTESRLRRTWFLAACSTFLVAVAGWMAFGERLVGRPATGEIRSIAVLPLENLSGDPQQDYFADGMTEAVITELGRINSLRVMSRSSVMAYKRKGNKRTLQEVARDLNVDAVVEGAVVREGDRVRLTAQLMRIRPEQQLWAERYERETSSILVLQADLARAIASEVRAKLTPPEQALLFKTPAVDPEAYEAYLKGRFHWNKASTEGLLQARQQFEDAIRMDPGFAPAHAALADTYTWSYRWGGPQRPPREAFPKAKVAALKALELDETLAEAHASLAYIKEAYDWDWEGAERGYRRAIELDPNSPSVRHSYALYLAIPRRFDEAFAQIRRAEALDPHSRGIKRGKGWLYFWAGEFDRALAHWQMLLELERDFHQVDYSLALAYTSKAMYEDAIAAHLRAITASGKGFRNTPLLAHAYGKSGRTSEALHIIAALTERAKGEYVSGYDLAIAHLGMGNKEEALRWLERAYEERDELGKLARAPFWWDPLRSDTRFQDLLRRLRLPNRSATRP
jgi:TolB-like protein/Tfp pilus assembly protein PilF